MQPNRRLRESLIWLAAAPVVTVAAITLAGCAPYWYQDAALTGFTPLPTQVITEAELILMCGSRTGCTKWLLDAFTVQSFTLADPQQCVIDHEAKHRAGWLHDDRPMVRADCGE